MRFEEAEELYGEKTWQGMLKYFEGWTVGVNEDGSIDYYDDDDCERAYRLYIKRHSYGSKKCLKD